MTFEQWAETQPQDNYVYVMACGHEIDFPYLRSEHTYARCSMHGRQELVSGDFVSHRWSPA